MYARVGQTPAGGSKREKHPKLYAYAYGAMAFLVNQPEQLDLRPAKDPLEDHDNLGNKESCWSLAVGSRTRDVLFRVLADRMS